jgi:hypothetical protein
MNEPIEEETLPYVLNGEARVYGEISDEILDRQVTIALGARSSAKDGWKNTPGTVLNLLQSLFTKHMPGEKDGMCMLQGETSGGRRLANAMVALDFLFIDIDNGMSRDDICGSLMDANLFAVIYSTYSSGASITPIKVETLLNWVKKTEPSDYTPHKPTLDEAVRYLTSEKNYEPWVLENAVIEKEDMDDGIGYSVFVKHKPIDKTRVVLLLKDKYKINERAISPKEGQAEWAARYRSVCIKLGIPFDTSCRDVSRLFYLPRHPFGSKDHHIIVLAGNPLDIEEYDPVDGPDPGNIFAVAADSLSEGRSSGSGPISISTGADTVLIKHAKGLRFGDLYAEYSARSRTASGGMIEGECPFDDDHSDAGNPEDFGFYCKNADPDGEKGYVAGCMHDTCKRHHSGRDGKSDRFKFASKFCADNGITGGDLKDYVDLEEGEKWCLAPAPMELPAPRITRPEGSTKRKAALGMQIYKPPPEDDDEEEWKTLPHFDSETAATEAVDAYAAKIDASVEEATDLITKLGHSGFEADKLIDEYLRSITKRSNMGMKAAKKIYDNAVTTRASIGADSDASLTVYQRATLQRLNKTHAEIITGNKHRVLIEPDRSEGKVLPTLLSLEDFLKKHSTKKMVIDDPKIIGDDDDNKKVRELTAKVWHEWPGQRSYNKFVFEPGLTPEYCEREKIYNIWQGFPPIEGEPGPWDLMHHHIRNNICQGNEEYYLWTMTWIAHLFQCPGEKEQASACVAIQGERGTGKSKLFKWLQKAMGGHAYEVSQQAQITGKFNAHMLGVILMVCEEAFWAGGQQDQGALKNLISSSTMSMERKGVDAIQLSNYARIAILSNEDWIVPASLKDERRFMVLRCGKGNQKDRRFFAAVDEQMENGGLLAMRDFFGAWDPYQYYEDGWDILREPPKTPWLIEQGNESLEPWDRFFTELVQHGVMYSSKHDKEDMKVDDIRLSETDEVLVSERMLSYLFNDVIPNNSHCKHYKKNPQRLDGLVRQYLLAREQEEVQLEVGKDSGILVTEKCYKVPPLPLLRANMEKMDIRLTAINDNEEKAA